MAGGDSYGASLSSSQSSAASLSGATNFRGGGNYGGTVYGPGSVVFGPSNSGASISTPALIGAAVVVAAIAYFYGRR